MSQHAKNVIEFVPLAYRMKEAVKVSGISKAKLYQEIADGKLRSVKKAVAGSFYTMIL
jgi:hypothetical protein